MNDRFFPLLGLHNCCCLYTSLYRRACLVFFRIVYFLNLLCANDRHCRLWMVLRTVIPTVTASTLTCRPRKLLHLCNAVCNPSRCIGNILRTYSEYWLVLPSFRVHSHWYEHESEYQCTGSSKHEFVCIPMVAVHIDISSVRVRVTCEFHSHEQFIDRLCFYPTRTM